MTIKQKKPEKWEYYKIYFKIRSSFNNNQDNEYGDYLHASDQVLRNIAMYLVENYKADYKNTCDIFDDCKERCEYLNTWLNEKKALYTSNGKCTNHSTSWEKYIEGLWKKLEEDAEEQKKCKRIPLTEKNFDKKWITQNCNNSTAAEVPRNCPDVSLPKDPVCPMSVNPTSSSCRIVLTTTYVVFGILLFFMYLLRFSSVGMKINNIIRGEKIKERNIEDERTHEHSNNEFIDRRFNLIYNSLKN
ncbi:PIR Superfamily Protein [Plasmodium ovale curtisi]|uniref:PIR Superfamily Protein n=3 Tax=Plasmodium ovale TaxID=36330 RepID=A0A1A8W7Y9_PLAOA|nr:PIR Superfamily Protein [Plasmodium ovale curtisi]